MTDDANAEPWDGAGAATELTVDGYVFLLDRETTEELADELHDCITEGNDEVR